MVTAEKNGAIDAEPSFSSGSGAGPVGSGAFPPEEGEEEDSPRITVGEPREFYGHLEVLGGESTDYYIKKVSCCCVF